MLLEVLGMYMSVGHLTIPSAFYTPCSLCLGVINSMLLLIFLLLCLSLHYVTSPV